MSDKPLDLVDPKAIEHLYRVASGLFAERGLSGVSLREISQASQVSQAALYYHFGSKQGLFEEVSLHVYEDFERAVMARAQAIRDQHSAPVALALAFFDTLTEDPDLLRLLQRDMITSTGATPSTRFLSQQNYRRLTKFVEQQLQLDTDSFQGEMLLFSFSAVINGYCELAMAELADPSQVSRERLARHRLYLAHFTQRMFAPT